MNLIFLGPPGTGKGTQAERISAELKIAHVSTGEMFRQLANEGNQLGVGRGIITGEKETLFRMKSQ